ncbi:MAG: hypothetical protein JNK10_13555, partial [Cyclobacteriaceae bacterium]|nr:hypothetical protein [Cyclobacteriaceae bacterium]
MRRYLMACAILISGCSTDNRPSAEEAAASAKLAEFVTNLSPSRGRGQGQATSDMSAETFERNHLQTESQLLNLRDIDTTLLKGDDLIDWKFAQSILVGRQIEQSTTKPWQKDPRMYMTFTGVSGILHAPGDNQKKINDAKARLKLTPIQLSNGKRQLKYFVPR